MHTKSYASKNISNFHLMGPLRRLTSPAEVPYVSCKVEHLSVSLASSSFLSLEIAFG